MRDRIDADERVVLFPTHGARLDGSAGCWRIHLHGWIHEEESGSLLRESVYRTLLSALQRLGIDPAQVDAEIPRRRLWPFLVDDERGERVRVEIQGLASDLPRPVSGPDGHFEAYHDLDESDLTVAIARSAAGIAGPRRVALRAGPSVDGRRFEGSLQLIEPRGISVLSDIDDTIKVTAVRDRHEMIANSFARPFRAIPGMARCYSRWAEAGAAFHYVSSSPYPLFEELHRFRVAAGFPAGSMHLKRVRITDASIFELFRSGAETKPAQILPILDRFPQRAFVLVGDSGEHDPEVYGALARAREEQIRHVAIRRVDDEAADSERMRRAFAGVARDRWTLFDDPAELHSLLP